MIFAGCDIGSLTSKAVLMKDGKILETAIMKSRPKPRESAEAVMTSALEKAGLAMGDIACCVGTGYGRENIPFMNTAISEITCHCRGALWLVPAVRTVIDIGGQDCKTIRIDEKGRMVKFSANDKCASGTGRFLEVMANILGVSLPDLGELSLRSRNPVTLASACTVWAQADVIQHLNNMIPAEDIAAGINNAMAGRIAVLANSLGIEQELCVTGGVAKNNGVINALERLLGIRIKRIRKADPQLAGALGAAVLAQENAKGA